MQANRRIILIVGGIALVLAVACPPWSYYHGEVKPSFNSEVGASPELREGAARTLAPSVWWSPEYSAVHIIRAIAIIGIFVTTVVAYLTSGPESEPARVRRIVFWAAVWCGALGLMLPSAILLGRLVRMVFR